MIVNKQEKRAGVDMEEINAVVRNIIDRQIKVALANADNYDNENNVIDDYVAADVHIAMARNNWENIDNMINEVLQENHIYQSVIRRVA